MFLVEANRMSNLRRWDPFNEMMSLRDAVNQLFEDSVVSPTRMDTRSLSMPLNVSETQDAFHVEAVLPGVNANDLDITIQDNILTIRGETRQEQRTEQKERNYHLVERRYGSFSRSVSLPTAVDADAVQAQLENGILRLEIPKAEEVKPRRITVSSGGAQTGQTLEIGAQNGQTQARGA
jgi:HSP20 family protein